MPAVHAKSATHDTPTDAKIHVVILGGGFGGVYAAMTLQRAIARRRDIDVTLVSRDNFFLFTPMLPQAATSSIDTRHCVVNLRRVLPRLTVFEADVTNIDPVARTVAITHEREQPHTLHFDHLLLAVGGEANFFGLPGVAEHALTMRTLTDAVIVRNRALDLLERAELEDDPAIRKRLLTFLIVGGGFAGVETAAELDLFIRASAQFYRNVRPSDVSTIVIDSHQRILPELSLTLAQSTQRTLEKRGVRFVLGASVRSADAAGIVLDSGMRIDASFLIWTGGVTSNPIVAALPFASQRGRVPVDANLSVAGYPGIWAVGDCAVVLQPGSGPPYPPTAQHALREGQHAARNILAAIDAKPLKQFAYTSVGQMAMLGDRQAVAMVGGFKISGFPAWWLWRIYYLFRIPTLERKIRVAIDWTLHMIFPRDIVQLRLPDIEKSG